MSEQPIPLPPLGLHPRYLWNELRVDEIRAAITRYIDVGWPIPMEWVEEYNALVGEKKP